MEKRRQKRKLARKVIIDASHCQPVAIDWVNETTPISIKAWKLLKVIATVNSEYGKFGIRDPAFKINKLKRKDREREIINQLEHAMRLVEHAMWIVKRTLEGMRK